MLADISFDCPSCGTKLSIPEQCPDCGLNPEILFQIRQAARLLALKSAQYAAEGLWQRAYENANESLLLQRKDNDLASFVILVSILAGATANVSTIPKPDINRLPKQLQGLAHQLIASLVQIHNSGKLESGESIDESIENILIRHKLDSLPIFADNYISEGKLHIRSGKSKYILVASLAVVVIISAFVLGRYTLDKSDNLLSSTGKPTTAANVEPSSEIALNTDESSIKYSNVDHDSLRIVIDLQQYIIRDQYREFVQKFLNKEKLIDISCCHSLIPLKWWKNLWNDGYVAYIAKDYKSAIKCLSFAISSPENYYFSDDALFFLARSYNRSGDRESAAAAYKEMIDKHSSTESVYYIKEAKSYIAQISN